MKTGFGPKNRIDRIQDRVTGINIKSHEILLQVGGKLKFDKLIIASGSRSNTLNCPGIDLDGATGLYHLTDLEKMESRTKSITRGIVVGGGLIGIEMAEMLHARKIPVTFFNP